MCRNSCNSVVPLLILPLLYVNVLMVTRSCLSAWIVRNRVLLLVMLRSILNASPLLKLQLRMLFMACVINGPTKCKRTNTLVKLRYRRTPNTPLIACYLIPLVGSNDLPLQWVLLYVNCGPLPRMS